ncbi:CocE/NonD hydrolase [Lentithecium fluviatile CBS 122367]|uniref:CocE/NonD hydrolase n=1 Tax=Lentithecium fluviatile CBS 122367 TaxID=1168545 RepID=A0A6G1IP39_9PLEO|nr:CocE/NonD hydrolase [Lentithecium fluviatile CBS 122367]
MSNLKDGNESWTRGFFGSLFDRGIGWMYSLPGEKCNYKAVPYRIPVSSDLSRIELAATLYAPLLTNGTKPEGTILVRCPYGRGLPISIGFARLFASRGYQVLFVSCRGTFGSGGEFDAFRDEVGDGKAVVEWMRMQSWYTGTFATIGMSYLGFTQWALLTDPPEDMVAAVIGVGPHDLGRSIWETGALNLDIVNWANMIAHQEEPYAFLKHATSPNKFRPVLDSIPLVQSVQAALPGNVPWLEKMMTTADLKDGYYTPMNLDQALERANIPIMLSSGWYDVFVEQSMEQYLRLHERGCTVALTMGPWDHGGSGFSKIPTQQTHAWIEKYLAKKEKTDRQEPVHYYVTGAEEWRWASEFPPQTSPFTLHLHAKGKLRPDAPASSTPPSNFTFDPKSPPPTVGGNILRKGGKFDDTALATRSDVLTFTSDALDSDVEFIGRPTVTLNHSTDSSYADLFVRISEVDAKGKSHNITDTYQRLDPGGNMEDEVTLSLHWCAHRFVKGKKIRVLVAGGSHPHFARNLGVANEDNRGNEMKAVKHAVYHGGTKLSKIVLPIRK